MNGHDYATKRNPARNGQFRRGWIESPRCEGVYDTSVIAAEIVADLRFQRQISHVHSLGVRVVGELLAEIAAERGIRTLIDQKLAIYAELDPKVIEAVEAAGFWPAPLHANPRRRKYDQ